eukprot:539720_1
MQLWSLCIFINSIYAIDIYCNNKFQCIGQINNNSNDWVHARGYKSLFQSTSSITSYSYCSGSLSCKYTPQTVTNVIYCDALHSCSKATIEATTVFGRGSNSLTNANISCSAKYSSPNCYCYGDKSCANSTILVSGSCSLKAYGALSLVGATINVVNGSLYAQLYAYYAAYQSFIYCQNGTICKIYCYGNACDGLSLICDSTAQCNITQNDITTTVYEFMNTNDILSLNATSITEINEANCVTQSSSRVFDNYQEHYNKGQLTYTADVGPICCRAQEACASTSILYNSGITSAATVVCSGSKACQSTDIISNSHDLMVECSGYQSCSGASIIGNGGSVYCLSDGSCSSMKITKMSSVYCNSLYSCSRSNIQSSGTDIIIHFNGQRSGHSASVICNKTDHCTILCSGYRACGYMQDEDPHSLNLNLVCYGTCSVECTKHSICPQGWTVNPTNNPTFNPTITTTQPTLNPSKIPTTAIPTTGTLYPTIMPSIFPSKSPTSITIYPTTIPTHIPTIEPTLITMEPTINPTLQPISYPSETAINLRTTHSMIHETYVPSHKSQQDSLHKIAKTFEYANIGVIALFSFIAITGFVDATFLRINDVFSTRKIIQPLFHILDAIADVFLCLEVSLIYNYAQHNQFVYLVLSICMAIFVLVPLIFSLIQLAMISTKYWINDKNMINSA